MAYDNSVTSAASLDVVCNEIHVIPLSHDGMLPCTANAQSSKNGQQPIAFVCKHLPPQNAVEQTLMSMWVNTHQAMFIATGVTARCVNTLQELLNGHNAFDEIIETVQLAIDCRLSSVPYTSLPFLNKALYEAYIRESMMLVHPGFSGVSNQESIALEKSLRALKKSHELLAGRNRALADALSPHLERLYSADSEWWRYHGKAMSKYVTKPVSLARMDFRREQSNGSGDNNFAEYRDRVLRETGALGDYDSYFAVQRSHTLTPRHYKTMLSEALEKSSPYIDQDGVLAEYRVKGIGALNRVIDAAIARQTDYLVHG